MNKLKIAIVDFMLGKPFQFRAGLLLAGILAGLIDSWYIRSNAMEASRTWLVMLMLFSTGVWAFMLTLYRIIQRVFKFGRSLPEHIRNFDERELLKAVGLYGLGPFGISFMLLSFFSIAEPNSLGPIIIVQGLSLYLGARISQLIKK